MILINSSSRSTAKIFQPFYPIHPPVGVGYLVSAAESAGIRVKFIDEQVVEDVVGQVAEYVKDLPRPYLFGFSVLTSALKNAIQTSQQLKKIYPDCVIVFGGIHATLVPDEVLQYPHIDAVIRGEGEKPLLDLYRCVKAGQDYTHIDNLSYVKNGAVVHNPLNFIVKDIDFYPPFPYHLFANNRYDMGFVISSRGCPYKCIFCSAKAMPGSATYRYRAPKAVVDEIELLYTKYGVRSLIFVDDNFLVNKKRVYALIEEIKARGLAGKLSYTFQARGDGIEETVIKDMYAAGFNCVLFGLETASETIMKTIKKGETVAECVAGVKLAKQIGYNVGATFVFGLPGDSHTDRMDCVRMTKQLDIEVVRYNNAIPYPGTELYEIARRENRLNIQGLYDNFIAVSGITESPFRKIPFAYVPEGSTADQLRRDILLAHFLIYLDLPRTFRIFFKSAHTAKWVNAGDSFFGFLKKLPALIVLTLLMGTKFLQLLYFLFIKRETALPWRTLARLPIH